MDSSAGPDGDLNSSLDNNRTKRRKLDNSTPASAHSKPFTRNNPKDWSEVATFELLDAWGKFYLPNGRKLTFDNWMEITRRVNWVCRTSWTDRQCRSRLDKLKKVYKEEKEKSASGWAYFTKMKQLLNSSPVQTVNKESSSPNNRPKKRELDNSTPAFAPLEPFKNKLKYWSEDDTFALLNVWGGFYSKHGQWMLNFGDWTEITRRVNKACRTDRTTTQCRNRIKTLKAKYNKEKEKVNSVWVYLKKMDELMGSSPLQPVKLSPQTTNSGSTSNSSFWLERFLTRSNDDGDGSTGNHSS